jgi:hypothetical protein
LFSYKKGWLLYAPVMAFALVGFWPLAAKYRPVFISVFVFFMAHLLLVASWPTWWYGGSFGQRAMMESYALLALPMGALVQWVITRKKFIRRPVLVVLSLFVALNLFQTWQYMHLVLDPMRITRAYYWSVFGKTALTDADRLFLEPNTVNDEREFMTDPEKYQSRVISTYDFEKPGQAANENLCRDTAHSGIYSLRMNNKLEFSPGLNMPYKELSQKDFSWVRATAWVYFTCKPEEAACGLVITCNQKGTAYKYRMLELEKQKLQPGIWNKVTMDYMTPWFDDRNNTLQVYFWRRGDKEVLVDDFEVRVFELR